MALLDKNDRRLLHEQLTDVLIGNLTEFPLNSRFYTDREVCKKFKVSPYVARTALSKLVDEGYIKRVVSKGTYVQSHRSREKPVEKTMNIGLFCPLSGRFPHTDAVDAIVEYMRLQDYSVIINNNKHLLQVDVASMADLIIEAMDKADGVIWIASIFEEYTKIPAKLKKYSDKIVFINSFTYEAEFTSVIRDESRAVFNLTNHMINHGYRRIGFIGGSADRLVSRTRLNGYKKAMEAAGIELIPEINREFTDGLLYETGYESMKSILDTGGKPEAIICVTDTLAFGVLDCLEDKNLKVPDDVAVAGFDNNTILANLRKGTSLTSVDFCYQKLGDLAAKALFAQIEKKQNGGTMIMDPCRLVIRNSCGCM